MAMGIGRCWSIAAVIAMTVGSLSLASAWVFYGDDRRRSHSTMVGTLQIELPEGTGLATAVLVDDCGILTNHHAVFGPWYVTALRPPSRAFPGTFTLTEVTRPDGTHPTARAIPVVWGDYRGPDRQLRSAHHDWAYLVLDHCLGLEYGHFRTHHIDLADLQGSIDGFIALGYSTGRQMVDPMCSVRARRTRVGTRVWLHDCALEAGDSGGPIIEQSRAQVVALGAGMVSDSHDSRCPTGDVGHGGGALARLDRGCANLAVPLTPEIINRIEAARIATAVQRMLLELGYDAGPLGAIDEPRAIRAIERVQRDLGWPVTGEPTEVLRKILWLRMAVS